MFRRRKQPASPEPAQSQGAGLRAMALGVDPQELGLSPSSGRRVWGVVMDTALSDGGWHSLVVFADGTTSLYTSAAFGIIGAGAHERVRIASDALLVAADGHLDLFTTAKDDAVPPPGMVTIRALTFEGPQVVVAMEEELGQGRHAASPVFHAAHEVITQTRRASP